MAGLSQASLTQQTHNQSDIRMNQIQVVGTHNSYHREINITTERAAFEQFHDNEKNLYYSHADLDIQLEHQSVRSLELDLHSDVNGGLYANPLLWRMANLTNATIPFLLSFPSAFLLLPALFLISLSPSLPPFSLRCSKTDVRIEILLGLYVCISLTQFSTSPRLSPSSFLSSPSSSLSLLPFSLGRS
jgi:hypothetical protein